MKLPWGFPVCVRDPSPALPVMGRDKHSEIVRVTGQAEEPSYKKLAILWGGFGRPVANVSGPRLRSRYYPIHDVRLEGTAYVEELRESLNS